MNRPNRKLYRLAWLLIPIIMLSACGLGNASEVKTTPLNPDAMVIFATMTRDYNGTHNVLNIYVDTVGFNTELTQTPPSGQEHTGLTATLWLVIVDHPETFSSFQVKTGQTISFEGFEIKILRIGGEERHFVEIEVKETE